MLAQKISSTIAVLMASAFAAESLAQSPAAGLDRTAGLESAEALERGGQGGNGEQALRRSRTFTLTYRATLRNIPTIAKAVELWLPLPQTDINQTIHRVTVDAPGPITIGREARFGNQCLHVSVRPPDGVLVVSIVIEATRVENSGSSEVLLDLDRAAICSPNRWFP